MFSSTNMLVWGALEFLEEGQNAKLFRRGHAHGKWLLSLSPSEPVVVKVKWNVVEIVE